MFIVSVSHHQDYTIKIIWIAQCDRDCWTLSIMSLDYGVKMCRIWFELKKLFIEIRIFAKIKMHALFVAVLQQKNLSKVRKNELNKQKNISRYFILD